MIIELIGVPGAGKSTITNSLIEKRRELKIKRYQDVVKDVKLNKTRRISFLGFALLHSIRFTPLFIKAVKNSNNKAYTIKRLQKLLIMLHNLKRQTDIGIIIMDQGLVQMLVSIFGMHNYKNDFPYNEVLSLLLKVSRINNYKLVYIDTLVTIAYDRVINRDKPDCAFKKMDSNQRAQALTAYSKSLETIQVDLVCNSKFSIKYNTEIIVKFISKYQ